MVAALNVNCDDTFEVVRASAAKLVGVPFTYVKMKGDRVINVPEQVQELTLLFDGA